jgi:D-amino-acid dehydrogenase
MGSKLRIGGTLELGNYDKIINSKRLAGILESIPKYYDSLIIQNPNRVWIGHRPCSPDGLPYIGKSSLFHNLYIGTGHGMMGMSMGPGTGKMISDLMKGQKSVINFTKFILR